MMFKKISMYARMEVKVPVRQRYWKKRSDGIKQRYWKTTKRTKKAVLPEGRYELHGRGRDLRKAVPLAYRYVPKRRFVKVSAAKFLEEPDRYSQEGRWVEKPTIESV